jgi:acetyl-CoA carboxylase carboxyltransferase component
MVRESSHLFITGPDVVRAVTAEEVSVEELGGASTHATRSGVCTFLADDEKTCLDQVRLLLSFLPSNHREPPPRAQATDRAAVEPAPALDALVPADPTEPYDVRQVIAALVDEGSLFEYFAHWARNIVCGFARVDGHPVGVVANQPKVLAGVLDVAASEKAARFVRTCDAFGIPLVTLVDVPGFLPGTDEEHGGIIRHGAKLLYAYAEASVPRIQLVLRKAYGGAYVVMDSKSVGNDLAYAWPSAALAVMAPPGAVEILHRRELAEALDPEATKAELVRKYTEANLNPYLAAEMGYVDDVITPADTRAGLVRSLEMLRSKKVEPPQAKHGNVPL